MLERAATLRRRARPVRRRTRPTIARHSRAAVETGGVERGVHARVEARDSGASRCGRREGTRGARGVTLSRIRPEFHDRQPAVGRRRPHRREPLAQPPAAERPLADRLNGARRRPCPDGPSRPVPRQQRVAGAALHAPRRSPRARPNRSVRCDRGNTGTGSAAARGDRRGRRRRSGRSSARRSSPARGWRPGTSLPRGRTVARDGRGRRDPRATGRRTGRPQTMPPATGPAAETPRGTRIANIAARRSARRRVVSADQPAQAAPTSSSGQSSWREQDGRRDVRVGRQQPQGRVAGIDEGAQYPPQGAVDCDGAAEAHRRPCERAVPRPEHRGGEDQRQRREHVRSGAAVHRSHADAGQVREPVAPGRRHVEPQRRRRLVEQLERADRQRRPGFSGVRARRPGTSRLAARQPAVRQVRPVKWR